MYVGRERERETTTEWLARNKGKCEKLVLLQDWQMVFTTKGLKIMSNSSTFTNITIKNGEIGENHGMKWGIPRQSLYDSCMFPLRIQGFGPFHQPRPRPSNRKASNVEPLEPPPSRIDIWPLATTWEGWRSGTWRT